MADPAKIAMPADPSTAFLQFLTGLGGTTGSSTTSSSIDPKVLAQLQTLLGTQMGQTTPEGAAAMIGEIFRIGGKQVPVLGQQFAQSAGARTSNNSPLNLANANLQAQLAGVAVDKLMALQAAAANTGAKIADSTKSTTTKSSQGKTSKVGQLIAAAPFLLGQAGNVKKLFNGAGDVISQITGGGVDSGFGSVTGGSGGFGQTVNNPSAFVGAAGDAVGNSLDLIDWSPAVDAISSTDFGSFAEAASNVSDLGALADFGSGLDFGNVDLGLFFADGGLVGRDTPTKRTAPAQKKTLTAKPKGYADGGAVAVDGSKIANTGSVAGLTGGFINPATGLPDFSDETLPGEVTAFYQNHPDEISAYNSWSSATPGSFGAAADGNNYFVNGNVTMGSGEGATADATMAVSGIQQRNTADEARLGEYYVNEHPIDKVFNRDGSFQDISYNPQYTGPAKDFANFLISAVSLASGNPALAFARMAGTQALKGTLQNELGKDKKKNIFGGKDTTTVNGYADGGPVPAGVKDNININVSHGEYILPADVTEAITPEVLDELVAMFHTPAATQKAIARSK